MLTAKKVSDLRNEYVPLPVGQRIKATVYGELRTGRVVGSGHNIVWARFDGATHDVWLHRMSVEVLP